ncbi:restriction endonuclease [Candidatus Woesearchaeota archaeon]|nr:restriction endonuclease [Candidatus Woesearchaeota archaeon]
MNTTESGKKFEIWIYNLLNDLGYNNLKHNLILESKKRFSENTRYQIDIRAGLLRKTYFECKYKTNENVSLKEVAKFAGVLELLNIKHSRGIMVTNQDYVERAKQYAHNHKIKLWNKNCLEKLNYKRLGLVGTINYYFHKKTSLEDQINNIKIKRW